MSELNHQSQHPALPPNTHRGNWRHPKDNPAQYLKHCSTTFGTASSSSCVSVMCMMCNIMVMEEGMHKWSGRKYSPLGCWGGCDPGWPCGSAHTAGGHTAAWSAPAQVALGRLGTGLPPQVLRCSLDTRERNHIYCAQPYVCLHRLQR